VACLIVKFPFDWVQDNKSISFQNYFSVYPWLTHLLTGSCITLNLKRRLIKIVPIDVHSKINPQPSFSPSVVLLTLVSNCTWAKVLENLTVSKLNIFIFYSTLIFPFGFILSLVLLLYFIPQKNLNYQSFSVLLVFLYFFGVYFILNFLFFIVHCIKDFLIVA
jgi:hypothetical protein